MRFVEGRRPSFPLGDPKMSTDVNNPSLDDLLLMAVFLHESRAQLFQGRKGFGVNGRPIVKQALLWLDQWDAPIEKSLYEDESHPAIDRVYHRLISMCRPSSDSDLIWGNGVLGNETSPPAPPTYVVFNVTELGRTHAARLLSRYPCLRSFKEASKE